jgi:hypothetical protein
MWRHLAATLTAVVLVSALPADDKDKKDKKDNKPIGIWTREVDEAKVKFEFKKDKLIFHLKNSQGTIDVEATYEVTKEGLLKGKITKVEKKGIDGGPDEGDTFSFKFKVKGDTFTLSELKDKDDKQVEGEPKTLIEGDYKKLKKNKDK